MNGYLEVVSPYLAPAIVNQEALLRLQAVARLLPPCSLAGLELRLEDNQPNVDFFVRLPYADPGLPPSLLNHPVWQALQRLCVAVASPSGWLHAQVRHIILEFDLDKPPSAVPIPGLFLELNANRTFAPAELLAITDSLDIDQHQCCISQEALDCCVKALPSEAKVAHVGLMLSRPGKALRLAIHGMPPAAVSGYLNSIGWLDPTRQLSALIADISALADPVAMVDIDVANTVRPRIGVEFYVRGETDNRPRWKALLAFLGERGLASPAKTSAVLAWPGFTQERADNHAWSDNLALGDLLFRGLAKSIFWRNINHIKLSYEPGQEPEVKVYLGFGHNWFQTGTVPAVRMTASKVEAVHIADRAVSFWERLRHREERAACSGGVPEQTQRRLDRWRHVAAKGDPLAFQRRLAWDDLTVPDVQAALACAEASAPRPDWLEVFDDLITLVKQYRLHPPATTARDRDRPRPFEDALLPLVYAARRRLHRRMQCPDSAELPRGLLSDQAYLSLELGLLDRLCGVCAQSLQADFSSFRPVGHSLLNALVGSTGGASTRYYNDFVSHLRSANLMPMFEKYPVLARLVVVVVENWVEYCAEFQSHLLRDLPLIERCFEGSSDGSLGQVVQLRFALSDFHRQGRCVIGVTFSCGVKLAYKPKPLGIDLAFSQLIQWCNQQGLTLDLKMVRVLDRPGYGWMEWVDQQPCADQEEARNFYRRAGMLLGLLHVLRCTDCHHENLIAHGGHLVLVDAETLMVPDFDTTSGAAHPTPNESFWQSVVRTGMLPSWETRLDTSIPCDLSALGAVEPQATPIEVPHWKSINADDMDVYYESIALPRHGNAAMLNGTILSPGDHVEDLVQGFAEMYRLLLRQRSGLLAADGDGLLGSFRTQCVRYVFRPTEQYSQILRRSLAPEHLQNGCDRGIELDHLSRGFVVERERTKAWALLGAERQALEDLDVPRFDVLADETTLRNGGQAIAPHFFNGSGYSKVTDRLASLSEADLALQTRIIEASLHAWRARSDKHFDSDIGRSEPLDEAPHGVTESERSRRFLIRANAVAEAVASSAVCNPDGSFSWIGLAHLPKIGRYQLLPVDDGLYGGRCGIALFLAACDHVNRSHAYRSLIRGTLQPLRALLRDPDDSHVEHYVRTVGIGIAEGTGGLVYALTCISRWWQDPTLQDDAEKLARAISPEALRADKQLDVMGGAAGAILGLMKLYRARPSSDVLRIAQDCADWLCRHQLSRGEDAGAWKTPSASRPLTGFSHGAAGMAYALTQLYLVTGESKLLAAAQAAIEFEHTAFLPAAGNWIDFRRHEPGMPPSCLTSWCHGAPGIGLARLALRSELQHPLLFPDLETALGTTQLPRSHTVDDLCCGSFGRFDILLYAARILGRKALSVAAAEQAWDILYRSDAFRTAPCDVPEAGNPGFFDGLAGIGYVLLRLVAPDDLPCVLAGE